MTAAPPLPWRGSWAQGLAYGGLGLPLAFVALPLYVVLPHHYATQFGVPLAALGGLLLAARLLDAFADPLIGRWVDRWLDGSVWQLGWVAMAAAVVLALGFQGLFFPVVAGPQAVMVWLSATLVVTYLAFSVLSVLHQAWGARLGGDQRQRARVVAWREGLALAGVLVASALPAWAGLQTMTLAFAVLLGLGLVLLALAPRAQGGRPNGPRPLPLVEPLRDAAFRRLIGVYLVNGIASAVPATLVLFFIADRLRATDWEPLFLGGYFAAAALSMPLWVQLVERIGLVRAWLLGMALAVVAFVWAGQLQTGDRLAFLAICLASGVALGSDLALPGALLAGVVQRAGHGGRLEGQYFGWWNFCTKLNLALAAGLTLPLLQLAGYSPGSRGDDALLALGLAYCALPCLLKAIAAMLLWRLRKLEESSR